MSSAEQALELAARVERDAGVSAVPHDLSKAFGEASKVLGPDSPQRQYLGWEEALYAYGLPVRAEPGNEAEGFTPFWQAGDSRYPPRVSEFPEEATDYFRRRLASSVVPTARARLSDFLWLRTREVAFADQAITEYANAACAVLVSQFGEMAAVEYLVRASALAERLRRSGADLRAAIRKVSESIPKERFGHVFYLVQRTAQEIVRDADLASFLLKELLEVANVAAERGGQERSTERFALGAAVELTKALGDTEQTADFRRRVAASFEREADERAADAPLIQAALLQDAVRQYANLGMREDLERAKAKLHVASQGAAANLKPLSAEVSISMAELRARVESLLEEGRQRAPWLHLQLLAVGALWRPWTEVVARTAELERQAPLTSLVSLVMLGPDARPFPRPTEPMAAREFNEIRRYVDDVQFGLGILGIEVTILRDLEGWSEGLILDALRAGAFFEDDVIAAIAPGVRAYENERYWEALHALVPQIERVIRGMAQSLDVDTYRYMSATGAIHWETLDQLLEEEPVRQLLAQLRPDLPKELKCLLADSRGLNLRHDVAHGILRPGPSVRDYALLCILILLTLSVFTLSEKRDSGGEPRPDADPGQ